jgi:hypothetical protein
MSGSSGRNIFDDGVVATRVPSRGPPSAKKNWMPEQSGMFWTGIGDLSLDNSLQEQSSR